MRVPILLSAAIAMTAASGSYLLAAHDSAPLWSLRGLFPYLLLAGVWTSLIIGHLVHRVTLLKQEVERYAGLQMLAARQAEIERQAACRDPLTDALNRRGLSARFDMWSNGPAAVILIDIDHFKSFNDRLGHQRGDEILATVAAILRRGLREEDLVGRWGGEEFLAICACGSRRGAEQVARKLRRCIESCDFGIGENVTASLGVHWTPLSAGSLAELVNLSDAALYQAKESGRNRVCTYRPGMAQPD